MKLIVQIKEMLQIIETNQTKTNTNANKRNAANKEATKNKANQTKTNAVASKRNAAN